MIKTERPKITKILAVTLHLEAAGFLILSGEGPVSTHTILSAARDILKDLHRVNENEFIRYFDGVLREFVKADFYSTWNKLVRQPANFLKHADNDPAGVLDSVDFVGLNELELIMTSLALWSANRFIENRLFPALIYCGLQNPNSINLDKMFGIIPESAAFLEELKEIPKQSQRVRMLDLFLGIPALG